MHCCYEAAWAVYNNLAMDRLYLANGQMSIYRTIGPLVYSGLIRTLKVAMVSDVQLCLNNQLPQN